MHYLYNPSHTFDNQDWHILKTSDEFYKVLLSNVFSRAYLYGEKKPLDFFPANFEAYLDCLWVMG